MGLDINWSCSRQLIITSDQIDVMNLRSFFAVSIHFYYMGESVSGQDKAYPAFWLATMNSFWKTPNLPQIGPK